jgi:electron transfer flavoprotein beta subunit
MLIAVIVKQVPDTEADVVIHPDNPTSIREDDLKWVLNPYDEYAVEAAVTIAEEHDAETVAVCIGPDRAVSVVRTAMAMGIDAGIHIDHETGLKSDVITEAKILAESLRKQSPTLILCGRESIDTGDDALAAALAEYLDLPHVLNVSKLNFSHEIISVERDVDGGILQIEIKLPGVVSCQKGLNEPRYPNLMAVRRAQKKPIESLTMQDLGMEAVEPLVRCKTLTEPPQRATGKVVSGNPEDTARQAVEWLTNDAKAF